MLTRRRWLLSAAVLPLAANLAPSLALAEAATPETVKAAMAAPPPS
jgi:hypothetical protein